MELRFGVVEISLHHLKLVCNEVFHINVTNYTVWEVSHKASTKTILKVLFGAHLRCWCTAESG